jgi:hypothetical protein
MMAGISPLKRKLVSLVPGGSAALQANDLAQQSKRYQKLGKPHAAASAKLLSKAKKGDPSARKQIKTINAQAKAGNPKAIRTMKVMAALDKGTASILDNLYREGMRGCD